MRPLLLAILLIFIQTPISLGISRLLFINRKDIRVMNFQKGSISKHILIKNVTNAGSVDYYYKKRIVCWADLSQESFIKCVSIDDTKVKNNTSTVVVIKGAITSAGGLAVDWVTEKLYWADSTAERIEVAELFGSNRKVLFWRELGQPRAIALVPSEGILFWSEWGEVPKLVRGSMNGEFSSRKIVVHKDILWPNGLTVDYKTRTLFWADGQGHSISAVDFDGFNRIEVADSLEHPFAVAFLHNNLYWTDWQTAAVHFCPWKPRGKCGHDSTLSLKQFPAHISAYDPSRQTEMSSQCHRNNGGCSHLCLLAPPPRKFSCACPTGVNLVDEYNCEDGPKDLLLLARRSDIRLISLDTPDRTPVVVPVDDVLHAIAVDFDPVDEFFYWTDDEAFMIQRARLNGSDQEVVIHSEGLDSSGIAVDWLARNLYWSDANNDWIEVARLDGSSRKVLVQGGLDRPRSIALDPEGGLMFWTDWGNNSKIERSYLDGTHRTVIVDRDLGWPNGVVVDRDDQKIFWADAKFGRIEFSKLDGSGRKILLEENLLHVFGFSLQGDFIYWTDWQKRSVERVHKLNDSQTYLDNLPAPIPTPSFREVLVDQIPNVMGIKAVSMDLENKEYSPCVLQNGGCSHLCFNRPNSEHVCDCPLGYELAPNALDCVSPSSYLMYAQRGAVYRVSLHTHLLTSLPISGFMEASYIDYDGRGSLYWIDPTSESIRRAFINGSKAALVVTFGLSYPSGLAVDRLAGQVYWSDVVTGRIEVCTLEGSYRRAIIWGLDSPRFIAVDPSRGFLFWVEGSENEILVRSSLDGSNYTSLVTILGHIQNFALDVDGGRIILFDQDTKQISLIDYEGQQIKVLVKEVPQLNHLSVGDNYFYWFDDSDNSIRKVSIEDESENPIQVLKNLDSVFDILIVHQVNPEWPQFLSNSSLSETFMSNLSNPCAIITNGSVCPQLCFFLPDTEYGYRCGCSAHFTFNAQNQSCIPPSSFMLVAQKSSINQISSTGSQDPSSILPIMDLKKIRSIAFDPLSDFLFWIDLDSSSIRRSFLNGSGSQVVVEGGDQDPFDLVVDGSSGVIFWSCLVTDAINATRIDGTEIGVVFWMKKIVKPRALALHSPLSLLFYVNDVTPPSLDSFELGSRRRRVLVSGDFMVPSALTLDQDTDTLFWIDLRPVSIQAVDIHGRNRRVLVDTLLHRPLALTVFSDDLFWIDSETDSIEKVNKFSGIDREIVSKLDRIVDIIAVSRSQKGVKELPCLTEGKKCSHFCTESPSVSNYPFVAPINNLLSYEDGHAVSEYFQSSALPFTCQCPMSMTLSPDGVTCVPKPVCTSQQFACVTVNKCIPLYWRCDGIAECPDGSDEMNCGARLCGNPSLFKCGSGECIDNAMVCDGVYHCIDRSDESRCCPPGEALCPNTGICISCSMPEGCPGPLSQCPFPITGIPQGPQGSRAPYIVGILGAVLVLVCVAASAFYYRRKPTMLDDDSMSMSQGVLKDAQPRRTTKTVVGGKMYSGVGTESVPLCYRTNRLSRGAAAQPDVCPSVSFSNVRIDASGPRGNASSSSSSMTHYPRETLNPPPTPVAEPSIHCRDPHYYYSDSGGSMPQSQLNSYRHYKAHNQPPPPTPCSTDVCDDSDFYSSVVVSPQDSRCVSRNSLQCLSPHSAFNSSPPTTEYDSEPLPPPPSPATDRSYVIQAPCPTPASTSTSE